MASTLKQSIHSRCVGMVQLKIDELRKELDQLTLSYGVETKSSSGDKYETNREMINQEKAKINERMEHALKMKASLDQIDPEKAQKIIDFGSLVRTDTGWYFISVPLGGIENLGHSVFAVSAISPIGKQLMGKSVSDQFVIGNMEQKILEVY